MLQQHVRKGVGTVVLLPGCIHIVYIYDCGKCFAVGRAWAADEDKNRARFFVKRTNSWASIPLHTFRAAGSACRVVHTNAENAAVGRAWADDDDKTKPFSLFFVNKRTKKRTNE